MAEAEENDVELEEEEQASDPRRKMHLRAKKAPLVGLLPSEI